MANYAQAVLPDPLAAPKNIFSSVE